MQELIDQIVSRIPDLTQEQVDKMNSAFLPIPEIVDADQVAGEATALAMAQLADDVDAGVYAVARTGILGICAKGLVPDETSATLLRVWTDIVEPLDVPATIESAHAPTEGELADLGAPDNPSDKIPPVSDESPAQSVDSSAKTSDSPEDESAADIQEGDIQV